MPTGTDQSRGHPQLGLPVPESPVWLPSLSQPGAKAGSPKAGAQGFALPKTRTIPMPTGLKGSHDLFSASTLPNLDQLNFPKARSHGKVRTPPTLQRQDALGTGDLVPCRCTALGAGGGDAVGLPALGDSARTATYMRFNSCPCLNCFPFCATRRRPACPSCPRWASHSSSNRSSHCLASRQAQAQRHTTTEQGQSVPAHQMLARARTVVSVHHAPCHACMLTHTTAAAHSAAAAGQASPKQAWHSHGWKHMGGWAAGQASSMCIHACRQAPLGSSISAAVCAKRAQPARAQACQALLRRMWTARRDVIPLQRISTRRGERDGGGPAGAYGGHAVRPRPAARLGHQR